MLGIARVVRKIAKTKLRSLRLSIPARAISLPISRTLPLMALKKNDDFEQTSVISQDELAAYFARLAQEESSAAAAASGSVEFAVSDEINVPNEVDEMAVTTESVGSNETSENDESDNDKSDEPDNEEAK